MDDDQQVSEVKAAAPVKSVPFRKDFRRWALIFGLFGLYYIINAELIDVWSAPFFILAVAAYTYYQKSIYYVVYASITAIFAVITLFVHQFGGVAVIMSGLEAITALMMVVTYFKLKPMRQA